MNDRFNFRIWNTHFQCYDDNIDYNVTILVNQDFGLVLYPCRDNIIEMCTGLKDKNRNLIYENDIVLDASGFKYCIIWSEMELGWVLQNLETKLCIAMNAFVPDEIEIIGNIHEQVEQKDVK